jgi:sugar lactone lactonase YvrE
VPPWPEQLNGFDFGPDGLLYSPQPFSGNIVRIDVDAASPAPEVVASGLTVSSVEFDSRGRLFASVNDTGEVVRVDTSTGAVTHVTWLEPSLDNMAFDTQDRLYVSNSHDGRVDRILPSGGRRQLSAPGLILPGGIAAVAGGSGAGDRLYVADLWSLAEYSGRTGRFTSIDANALIGQSITTPWTVAADGPNVIVTSWMANLVQVWDPAANAEVASWPDFAVPVNAIRFGSDLVVAELGTGSVVRQAPGGARTTVASGLYVPSGLAATNDDLWVTDWASGIVWRIVTDGAPSLVPVAMGLAHPEGLAVDRDGSLLVVESGAGRLTRILPSGAMVTVAEGLALGAPAHPSAPPAWMFNGVAIGPSGAIYVTGDAADVIYRITVAPR